MDDDDDLLVPDLLGVPEDDEAEPGDADATHTASPLRVRLANLLRRPS